MTPRKLSHILCLLLVLVFTTSARLAAQTSTVSGTITSRGGDPVVNVFVSIGGRFRYTDGAGRYLIYEVPQGKQHMIIKRGTRVLWEGDVNISGQSVRLDRVLS